MRGDFMRDSKLGDMLWNVRWRIEHFFEWVAKVVVYAKFLWGDYDNDYFFIFRTLKFKLERTRKHVEERKLYEGHEKVCKQIRLCELLIQRTLDSNYVDEMFDKHLEKWGPITFKEKRDDLVSMGHANVKTPADKEKERKEFKAIMRHEDYMYDQDIELFFATFKRRYRRWST